MLKKFGRIVKRYRLLRDMTQQQLALKAEITPEYLSGIENGKHPASIKTLCRLADALNTKLSEMFRDAEEVEE